MPQITLPDGAQLDFDSAVTIKDVAKRISNGLAKVALGGKVNGEVKDLSYLIETACTIEIITPDSDDGLYMMRHSAAHVMAEAICVVFPGTKLAYGPPVTDGFYYDVDAPEPIGESDLPRIEKAMKKIVKRNEAFVRNELNRAEALEKYAADEYKTDNINRADGDVLSFYAQGKFADLCRGPHVPRTGKIGFFKIMSVAGAYWHGDESQPQLTRVYGTTWATQAALDEHLARLEEAKKRDHRKLGRDLKIFIFDDEVGPGLPLWLPNGSVLIEEIEGLAKEQEAAAGYDRVRTPHVCKESMYLRSGHLPYYADSMFPPMEFEGVKYYLKPMNCPHHHKIFAAESRSYRDLPVRLAEYGTCYRYEKSGELFGLMRVRSMQMNDAHIYCTIEQFEEEFLAVCRMYLEYFKIFGIEKYNMRLSTHDTEGLGKKFVDAPELWLKTEDMVRRALQAGNIPTEEVSGEAAFYGPKIDVEVWSAIGREFTLATNQVDFAVPERFGLTYKNADNAEETPLCIHRAPLGTHERFIGFLIEHFAGDFPLWLAPEQVRVLTITDKQIPFAKKVHAALRERGLRAKLDERGVKIGAKIREGELLKVPYMAIIGDAEVAEGKVAVRRRLAGDLGGMSVDAFVSRLVDEIKTRALPPLKSV